MELRSGASEALQLHSRSPDATRRIASALAAAIDDDGAVVLLDGPLGAGKTEFAKGIALGLDLPAERVQSPTFVVAVELPLPDGRRLVHVDCYRVGGEAELESAGLLDWLAPGALVVVEWAERVPGAWPEDRLAIRIARDAHDASARDLSARAQGSGSEALLTRWRAQLPDATR